MYNLNHLYLPTYLNIFVLRAISGYILLKYIWCWYYFTIIIAVAQKLLLPMKTIKSNINWKFIINTLILIIDINDPKYKQQKITHLLTYTNIFFLKIGLKLVLSTAQYLSFRFCVEREPIGFSMIFILFYCFNSLETTFRLLDDLPSDVLSI